MRTLVTGGTGFVGSNLVDALLARGDEVIVIDDLSNGRWESWSAARSLCFGKYSRDYSSNL